MTKGYCEKHRYNGPGECPECDALAEARMIVSTVVIPPAETLPSNGRSFRELVSDLVACALIEGHTQTQSAEHETQKAKQLVLDAFKEAHGNETRVTQQAFVTTYDVVAYNESWGGYGDNASKDGFASADEAIAYAKSCPSHLNARVWQRTKPNPGATTSVLLYAAPSHSVKTGGSECGMETVGHRSGACSLPKGHAEPCWFPNMWNDM